MGMGMGPGFGEEDDSDGRRNKTSIESFETLGLDPKTELIKNQLKRAIVY